MVNREEEMGERVHAKCSFLNNSLFLLETRNAFKAFSAVNTT